jgi:hypothetical protein
MGTQQLLLIVLGVIIVGIAVAVGLMLFKSNSQSSDRDQVVGDLENLGAKAQQYYRKPTSFAGGGYDFQNFNLMPLDTGNGNGSYSVTTTEPTDAAYVPGATSAISGSQQLIYIVGSGKETGNNGIDPVKAFMKVTKDSLIVSILN